MGFVIFKTLIPLLRLTIAIAIAIVAISIVGQEETEWAECVQLDEGADNDVMLVEGEDSFSFPLGSHNRKIHRNCLPSHKN
jgi:hypothetical protein